MPPPGEWRFYRADMQLIKRMPVPAYTYDPRTRPWFEAAAKSETTELSAPYAFFTTRETGITLSRKASPETGGAGTIFGIDVTVTDLSSQLAELRQTPHTRIAIVNRDRQVLADSGNRNIPGPAIAGALDQAGEDIEGSPVNQFTAEGGDWYGMTEPLGALQEEELTIAVAIPADELLAEVWQALARQTVIAGLIALLLLVLGWFLGRQVGRPLEHLTDQVSRLSRFRFDTPVRSDSHIREARQLSVALDDMAKTIRSFQNIATVLNRGQDLNSLLRDILEQIVHIVGQERGGIYLFSRQQEQLTLAVNQNLELPETISSLPAASDDYGVIRVLQHHIAGHPVFAVLRNRRKHMIGVLAIEMELGENTQLSDDLIVFVDEIAGSAAVAIETRELIESQQALLEGIIRLVANAIDAKSPYTGGHCERVPKLAQMLVNEAIASDDQVFGPFRMTEDQLQEFHLAAWLHDCGKITSPEYVVDKAVKLETIHNRIHEIRTRFEVLHRDAEIRYPSRVLKGEDEAVADRECQETRSRHFSDRLGLSPDEKQALKDVPEPALPATEQLLADKPEQLRPWGELHNLTVAKGTLTNEERFKINEHIVQTICMLDALPLPDRLANVPRLAGTHHERMDGTGYPCGLAAADLGIPERIMAVADVFEALTAVDRPYKAGKTLSESLEIMDRMADEGHIDGAVFELFVRSGTYQRYAEAHLRPEQIDHVDESLFMKPD